MQRWTFAWPAWLVGIDFILLSGCTNRGLGRRIPCRCLHGGILLVEVERVVKPDHDRASVKFLGGRGRALCLNGLPASCHRSPLALGSRGLDACPAVCHLSKWIRNELKLLVDCHVCVVVLPGSRARLFAQLYKYEGYAGPRESVKAGRSVPTSLGHANKVRSALLPRASRMQWSHMYLRIKFPSLDQIVSRASWSES